MLLSYFYEQVYTSGDESLQSVELAQQMLTIALQKFIGVYVVIDGLDECQIKEKAIIHSWVSGYVQSLAQSDIDLMRCIFISQADNDCTKLLKRLPTITITNKDNESDITAYCRLWEKKIHEKFFRHETDPLPVATKVAKDADGTLE